MSSPMHRLLQSSAAIAALLVSTIILPAQRAAAFTTLVAQHSQSCLDVTGGPGQVQDGALIEQWHCTTAKNQNWKLEDAGEGRFHLVAESSSKCIEPVNGGTNIATLQQMKCNGTTGQLWFRQKTALTGVYEFVQLVSGKCLNVENSSTADEAAATLADCSGGANQQWKIVEAADDPKPQTEIIVKHSGMCLDVTGGPGATGNNKPLEQWPCSGASNESFSLKDMGGNQVQIMPSNTSASTDPKCVQAASDGVSVEQYSCSAGDTKQLWKRQPGRLPGDYKLMNVATSTCLDETSNSTVNPDPVQLATCTNSDHQNWSVGKRITLEMRAGEYWGVAQKFGKKSPYGGLYQIWGTGVRWNPLTDLYWVGTTWADYDLDPQSHGNQNAYDDARLEDPPGSLYGLEELGEQNKQAIIWFSVTSPTSVPPWVLTKCSNAGTPITPIKNGSTVWGYAIWEDCPRTELTRFIRGMFSKYKNDPRVAYAYATTLSSGEFYMPAGAWTYATTSAEIPQDKRVTPEKIQAYAKAVIDAWADALGEKKIIWTSAGWATADPNNVVSTYALQTRGMQLREGIAEGITSNITQTLIGQGLVDLATLPSDEQDTYQQKYLTAKPMQQIGREGLVFYGDEFEKAADLYNGGPNTYAGVFDNYEYYRMAVLNMLRKGENYAIFPEELRTTDNDAAHPQFAVLRDYFRQTAGYPEDQALDGWAVLQVWYDGSYQQRRYHNYEKYVRQREVTGGGLTRAEVPSEKNVWPASMFAFSYKDSNNNTVQPAAYFSKSTYHATGNDYIYFDVDPDFATNLGSQYRIAVYYRDVGFATWSVQYTDTHSTQFTTETVTNTNDGQWKTAIFTVPKIGFVGAMASGMDFRIYNGGSSDMTRNMDVTVGSVRIIRY